MPTLFLVTQLALLAPPDGFISDMASRAVDDCDGVFVSEADSLDEVDASQVFNVSHQRETPSKYIRILSQDGAWQKTAVARPKMVSLLQSDRHDRHN